MIKDHKSDFKTNPECRLINPAKTQIGRVSKIIVQEICDSLRLALISTSGGAQKIVLSGLRNTRRMIGVPLSNMILRIFTLR